MPGEPAKPTVIQRIPPYPTSWSVAVTLAAAR